MGRAGGPTESDEWFVPKKIKDTFDIINKEVEPWLQEPPRKPSPIWGGSKASRAFRVAQSVPPRLLRMVSNVEGEVTFELTEVEGGGTSVRTTFNPMARPRLQTLRTQLPTKAHGLVTCKNCSKVLLKGFTFCPYCGEKR